MYNDTDVLLIAIGLCNLYKTILMITLMRWVVWFPLQLVVIHRKHYIKKRSARDDLNVIWKNIVIMICQ